MGNNNTSNNKNTKSETEPEEKKKKEAENNTNKEPEPEETNENGQNINKNENISMNESYSYEKIKNIINENKSKKASKSKKNSKSNPVNQVMPKNNIENNLIIGGNENKKENNTKNINKEEIKIEEPKNIINININNKKDLNSENKLERGKNEEKIVKNEENRKNEEKEENEDEGSEENAESEENENKIEKNEKQKNIEKDNIEKEKIIPKYCTIFENINIFNSILIMINNVSKINEKISNINAKDIIDKCEQNNKPYCLSSILYYLNKYMWNDKNENIISEKELYEKYKNYIDYFSMNNSNNANPENYCYNTNNVVQIFESILKTINNELSKENKNISKSFNVKNHPIFSKYINNFANNNKSMISDYFIIHFIFMQYCENCLDFCKKNNLLYNNTIHNYYNFYNLIFNIDNINNYYKENNKALRISFNNNIQTTNYFNLIDCFDYTFICNNNITKRESCINCNQNKYINQYFIFLLPNILPILFINNNNYNFVLQDKINLKDYEKNDIFKNKDNSDNKHYKLTSILCQIIYNQKFICYCINPNNGLWYSYSDGKINKIENMDINAIPLIAFYQNEETIKFKYNNIKRDDKNQICVNINFINQMPDLKLLFNKNTEIKNVIQYIKDIRHLEGNIKLLKSGTKVNDEEILIDLIDIDKDSLEFTVHIFNNN